MGRKTAVTGATGFVGSHIVRRLVERGENVVCLCRPGSSRPHDLPVEWREGDLRDRASLDRFLDGCSDLFHCAADYRFWSRDPADLYRSNVGGTRKILAAAASKRIDRIVYTSTVGALGIPAGGGAGSEETPVSFSQMHGHYKRSKFLAEEAATRAEKNGLHVVIVNPSTPVGSGDRKPTPTGKMILDYLNGRMPAYLDTGLNLAPVQDIAEGHLLARSHGQSGRRYILGGRNMTLHSILKDLASITGLPEPQLRIPHLAAIAASLVSSAIAAPLRREPAIPLESVQLAHVHMFFDDRRARTELGYSPGSTGEALRQAVTWYLQEGYVRKPHRERVLREHLSA